MSSILRLGTSTPTPAVQVPFYDPNNGRDCKASLTDIAAVLQTLLTSLGGFITQYANPAATGFSVTVAPPVAGTSVFLLLNQLGPFAAGTIVLPAGVDGQEVLVHSRQAVTAITFTPAANETVSGPPPSFSSANGSFCRFRFDGIGKMWCRVG